MTGRLAIDFGTSNTVVAIWDEAQQEGIPVHIPDFGNIAQQNTEQISVIPSLVHYSNPQTQWIGNQVLQQNLLHSPRTFRWMKRYISNRSPLKIRIDNQDISPQQAGQDFLKSVLLFAKAEYQLENDEIALTVPVESFEHYETWLAGVAEAAGIQRFRLIDEPSAAALGYGAHIQPGDVYLIFDFGGGTMHAAVILIEKETGAARGKHCRVLGKAGVDFGGMNLDQYLFEAVLEEHKRNVNEESIRQISNALLGECERAKIRLSFYDRADISVVHPTSGFAIASEFTRDRFEDILDQHEAFNTIDRTIRRALNDARERGYTEENIKAVLMVGGSSQIPAVQKILRRIFGTERVMMNRPLDAIARGAASFIAGMDFYDHIQHDYGLRYYDRRKGEYDYSIIVPHGTSYPTKTPISRITVKAAYDDQTRLGMAIFEIGESHSQPTGNQVELIFDPAGSVRLRDVSSTDSERRSFFWMNEHVPTFLVADPPGSVGEPRFEVTFNVDQNKRLLITARDMLSGKIVYKDYPVIKLT